MSVRRAQVGRAAAHGGATTWAVFALLIEWKRHVLAAVCRGRWSLILSRVNLNERVVGGSEVYVHVRCADTSAQKHFPHGAQENYFDIIGVLTLKCTVCGKVSGTLGLVCFVLSFSPLQVDINVVLYL